MKIRISSIVENSLLDVLFHPSFVIFFSGCNFRCPWCQNSPVVLGEGKEVDVDSLIGRISENFIVDYVQANGGEPTLQKEGLKYLYERVREIGKKNSLATNGSNPKVLKELFDLLDHVSIDVKAPPHKYSLLTGVDIDFKKIEESLRILAQLDFVEVRTTVVPELLTDEDIFEIAELLLSYSTDFYYVLQQFQPSQTILSERFRNIKRTDPERLLYLGKKLKSMGLKVAIRTKEFGVKLI